MKVCSKCGIEKDDSEFGKLKKSKDGLRYNCKQCRNEYRKNNSDILKLKSKKWYYENKEKAIIRNNNYKEKDPQRWVDYRKQRYEFKKDEILKKEKERRDNNKEIFSERKKEWRLNNIEKVKEMNKNTYEKCDKQKRRIKQREWTKNKRENIPEFDVKLKIAHRFREGLKRQLLKKSDSFYNMTGIAYAEYITYFENNFPAEFSEITEKGKYHIDHIIPCAVYDFNNPEHIKLCWQPENLRIIPAKENLEKNDKLDFALIEQYNIKHLLPKKIGA